MIKVLDYIWHLKPDIMVIISINDVLCYNFKVREVIAIVDDSILALIIESIENHNNYVLLNCKIKEE